MLARFPRAVSTHAHPLGVPGAFGPWMRREFALHAVHLGAKSRLKLPKILVLYAGVVHKAGNKHSLQALQKAEQE